MILILFNGTTVNGGTCYMLDGNIHTPLPDYLNLQKRIAHILLKKTKRLIFACTTPVWPEQFTSGAKNPRKNEDILAFNKAATEMANELGIEVNDLNSPIAGNIKKYIGEDMVHLTNAGNNLCAKNVAEIINR